MSKEKKPKNKKKALSWDSVMAAAMKIPGAAVNRTDYLKTTFAPYGNVDGIEKARPIDLFAPEIIEKEANDAIASQTLKVTSLSTLAGIPGGVALFGTIPGDLAQYYYHILIIAQKLGYIYGWPDLADSTGNITEGARHILTIFVGVMLGADAANKAVAELAKRLAGQVAKALPEQVFTKTVLFPLLSQIAKWIGVQITKESLAKGISKVVPILGGMVSGGITYATFKPCSRKLQKQLREEMALFKGPDEHYYFDKEETGSGDRAKGASGTAVMDEGYLIAVACINMAKIDTEINEDENSYLQEIIFELELDEEMQFELLKSLKEKTLTDLEFSPEVDDPYFGDIIIPMLIRVAKLDGDLTGAERVYLYKVAKDIGMQRKEVDSLIDITS